MKKYINNYLLFIPLILIMLISFFDMYNAKYLSSIYKYNLYKQIIWYILGFIILYIISKINLKTIYKHSKLIYYISVILLLLVLLTGKSINGSKAWFDLKIITFQPSELMKLSLTLYLSKLSIDYKNEFKYVLKLLILTIIPSILVFLEPDTGAIIFYILIFLSIIFTSKINKSWFILICLIFIISIFAFTSLYLFNQDLLIKLIGTSFFYRVERLITFKTQNSYQLENALISIGASSFFKFNLNKIMLYIPEAPTDFIFAFTISNFGIFIGIIILISYFLIDIYLLNKIFTLKDNYIKNTSICFFTIFVFGQIINIGMNLGLLPIIGIPLPFLSYGGSNIIIYFIFLAIIIKSHI